MALSQSLVVSVLLHAAVVGAFGIATRVRPPTAELPPALSSSEPQSAAFGGDTFEVEALVDAPARAQSAPSKPAAAEPDPAPAPPPPTSDAVAEKPKPKPRPRRAKLKRTESSAASEASTASPSAEEPDAPGSGATYGAADLPPGVRHLGPAFTRAISAASNRDPFWTTLALGKVGTARITIGVNEDGKIERLKRDDEPPLAAPLERLVERTLVLLRSGRFALSRRAPGAGREVLEIEVLLSQVEPLDDVLDDAAHTTKMGFSPPEPGKPGRAFFVHVSGFRFDARVAIVAQTAR
jgi:outer membrane biosynthesis protein TonB